MQYVRARRFVAALFALSSVAPLAACGDAAAPSRPAEATPSRAVSPGTGPTPSADRWRKLERRFDARVGVHAVDTGTGREITYKDRERFAHASSFKALAVGAVLRTYTPKEREETIRFSREDLVSHSPRTEQRLGSGMSLNELCQAAIRFSDNTAANLLIDRLGGPEGLEAELRELGDDETRTDRKEPDLNDWTPGETRDTSTPRALAAGLRAYVLGDALTKSERALLTQWLRNSTTGTGLIRAGVPENWLVGDKSGAGGTYGTRNDIAVLWPPHAAPIVVAIMSNRPEEDASYDDALIAEAASIVADAMS
ncbi:class A beta-lactamase [Streptomyces sp. NPDC002809]|uniref:class A beta-lactamase n=1 Tax=Streptomyces sp. NPDC002809 TaxID=3154433 RepID=UPI003330DAE4